MPFIRMLPPISAAQQTITRPSNGGCPRVLSAEPGDYLDADPADAFVLRSNGWIEVGLVGGTAARPPLAGTVDSSTLMTVGATPGRVYVDTDVGAVLVFDGAVWRNPLTGAEA